MTCGEGAIGGSSVKLRFALIVVADILALGIIHLDVMKAATIVFPADFKCLGEELCLLFL